MTEYVDIPIIDEPFYDLSIALEGNSYILEFTYNERMELYTLSLYDAERNPIVLGEAVVPEYPMFFDYAFENLTGYFFLTKKSTLISEPYKTFPDKLSQYYYMVYAYTPEE
jgi:hypothetical protein